MSRRWTVFDGEPNGKGKDVPRVTLGPKKVLLLNRKAYEVLGSPAAVELRFDEETRTIGLRPRDVRHSNAFPLHVKGARHKTNAGSPRYTYRIIYAAPFCRHFEIKAERTVLFNNVDLDDDGTMLLEMSSAVRVGRGSR
jgi:hypothetical protein